MRSASDAPDSEPQIPDQEAIHGRASGDSEVPFECSVQRDRGLGPGCCSAVAAADLAPAPKIVTVTPDRFHGYNRLGATIIKARTSSRLSNAAAGGVKSAPVFKLAKLASTFRAQAACQVCASLG